mgnify:FL=1
MISPSNPLTATKSIDNPLEDVFQEPTPPKLNVIEEKLAKQAQINEQRLFSELTDYFDKKFEKMANTLQSSFGQCEGRVNNLENKFNLLLQHV